MRPRQLQLASVAIPSEIPYMTTIFIVLRKMRLPLILLIGVMTIAVLGLSLMPGVPQPDGTSGRLSAFEAFYVFSYTATTIGFGEVPHEFSIEQRWWIVFFIYTSVLGWAYTIARLMSLLQDSAFNATRNAQTVRRTISHIRQPFTIIVGYGYIGRSVARVLDSLGRRIVVLDAQSVAVERLSTDMMLQEIPGVCGDARSPSFLGLAGMGHPDCEAVLAMTGNEEVNLQVLMTCSLLRPNLPVIARASSRRTAQFMADFAPQAIINPFEDYGNFLILALQHPHTYRLITWLMAGERAELPPLRQHSKATRWLIVSDDQFGEEIAQDLSAEGYEVCQVGPSEDPDYDRFDAVIAGAESDTVNLALAAHLRAAFPQVFLVVRQQSHSHLPLLDALCPDSVFFPPQLVAQRAVANIITPRLWGFITDLMQADDQVSQNLTTRLVTRIGTQAPMPRRLWIGATQTPTVARWLKHRSLVLGAIFRSPQDHETSIAAMTLMLIRSGEVITLPGDDVELRVGDELVIVGTRDAFDEQSECLFDDSTLFYVATGRDIPTSRAWRRLTRQRWKDAFPIPGDDAMADT
ncbi:MAG: NAD-binding protein [Propionibacteriaceae bacterium]|nr:NAD-binding protein [Propionibacteriaceae bacterium]